MTSLGRDLDAARARVAERDLTGEAVAHLTELVTGLPLEALAPVKQLLKRFFSTRPWTDDDDDALADAVGAGSGGERRELEPGLVLVWGWEQGRFRLRLENERVVPGPAEGSGAHDAGLARTFEGVVVPQATPSPRTIRFATPPLQAGPGRAYDSAAGTAVADPRVARIFADFDEVTNVLVGPDFVAVTIARPEHWEALLGPMLDAVALGFTGDDTFTQPASAPTPPVTISLGTGFADEGVREPRRLERAWAELGGLRADRPEHLDRILVAARDAEAARRQVAAALLADAAPDVAAREWQRLLGDRSRSVRRSVIDAVADTGREELRPLLDTALEDTDGWARWKALRGIAGLGLGSSRAAVEARSADPDFRVRLEVARVLAGDSR